jgi:cytochrome c oxidase subunit 4
MMHTETHTTEHAHPGFPTYIKIALILTVITAIEVAVYYIDALRPALVPVLLALSIVKFALVVGYFMHLKFDPRLLSGLFVFGLVIALAVFTGLVALFHHQNEHSVQSRPVQNVVQTEAQPGGAQPTGGGH